MKFDMIADTAGSHDYSTCSTHRVIIVVRMHEHHFGLRYSCRHRFNRFQYLEQSSTVSCFQLFAVCVSGYIAVHCGYGHLTIHYTAIMMLMTFYVLLPFFCCCYNVNVCVYRYLFAVLFSNRIPCVIPLCYLA